MSADDPKTAPNEMTRLLREAIVSLSDTPEVQILLLEADKLLQQELVRSPKLYEEFLRRVPTLGSTLTCVELLDSIDCLRYLSTNAKTVALGLAALIKLTDDRRSDRAPSANRAYDSILWASGVHTAPSPEHDSELLTSIGHVTVQKFAVSLDRAELLVPITSGEGVWSHLPRLLFALLTGHLQPQIARTRGFNAYTAGLFPHIRTMARIARLSTSGLVSHARDSLFGVLAEISPLGLRSLEGALQLMIDSVAYTKPDKVTYETQSGAMLRRHFKPDWASTVGSLRKPFTDSMILHVVPPPEHKPERQGVTPVLNTAAITGPRIRFLGRDEKTNEAVRALNAWLMHVPDEQLPASFFFHGHLPLA